LETEDGYVITGRTESEGARKKAFLLKTDFKGKKLWEKVYGQDSVSISVLQAKDGGFVFAGYIESEDSSRDAWLSKTDSSGDMQWSILLGGPGQDMATSVVQSRDGGYVVAGITNSFGAGAEDAWLVKVRMDNATSSTGYPAGNLTGNTDARSVNKLTSNDSSMKPAKDILK
jgi:hypothetical protein